MTADDEIRASVPRQELILNEKRGLTFDEYVELLAVVSLVEDDLAG